MFLVTSGYSANNNILSYFNEFITFGLIINQCTVRNAILNGDRVSASAGSLTVRGPGAKKNLGAPNLKML